MARGFPGGRTPHDPLSSQGPIEVSGASVVHSGLGAPDPALGQDGDFYIQQDPSGGCQTYQRVEGTWVACGAGGQTVEGPNASLTRNSSGLVWKDEFDRPDDGAVNGGWTEQGVASIATNRCALGNSGNRAAVNQVIAYPSDFIIEGRATVSGFANSLTALAAADGLVNIDGIDVTTNAQASGGMLMRRWDAGAIQWTETGATALTLGDKWKTRLVVDRGASQYRGYFVNDGPGISPLFPGGIGAAPTTIVLTHAIGVPPKAGLNVTLSYRDSACDYVFLCGRIIAVSGLPTGWQVRFIPWGSATSQAVIGPFAEVAGVASVVCDTLALPMHKIQILNGTGGVEVEMSPGDGGSPAVYGGDVFTVAT